MYFKMITVSIIVTDNIMWKDENIHDYAHILCTLFIYLLDVFDFIYILYYNLDFF